MMPLLNVSALQMPPDLLTRPLDSYCYCFFYKDRRPVFVCVWVCVCVCVYVCVGVRVRVCVCVRCRNCPVNPKSRTWLQLVLRSRTLRRSEEHTSELQSHLNLVCRL